MWERDVKCSDTILGGGGGYKCFWAIICQNPLPPIKYHERFLILHDALFLLHIVYKVFVSCIVLQTRQPHVKTAKEYDL